MGVCMIFLYIVKLLILVILLPSIDIIYIIYIIHKYEKTYYKIMFGLIKKMFIGLTNGLVDTSNDAKCISLSNQKCDIQPTLTNE